MGQSEYVVQAHRLAFPPHVPPEKRLVASLYAGYFDKPAPTMTQESLGSPASFPMRRPGSRFLLSGRRQSKTSAYGTPPAIST